MWETEQFWDTINFIVFLLQLWTSMVPQNSLVTNFLQNIFLCSEQRNSYRFEATWGWVNDDRIVIFG